MPNKQNTISDDAIILINTKNMIKKKIGLYSVLEQIFVMIQIDHCSIKYTKKITRYPTNILHIIIHRVHIMKMIMY